MDVSGPTTPEDPTSWAGRVAYSMESGGFAYRPGELIVGARVARQVLAMMEEAHIRATQIEAGAFRLIRGGFDALHWVELLRIEGMHAQLNHVLFAHCTSCCPPHPSTCQTNLLLSGTPLSGNPLSGNPLSGNPLSGNPLSGNPALLPPGVADTYKATGQGASSARPADDPGWSTPQDNSSEKPEITVIDTAFAAQQFRPQHLNTGVLGIINGKASDDGEPDENGDHLLDRVAGHSTFIAGLIQRVAPNASVTVARAMNNLGDCDEAQIVTLLKMAEGNADLINLSFGGYTADRMRALAAAIRHVQLSEGPWTRVIGRSSRTVVVASAGNDATCRAPFPARLPDVVSVGAIGPNGPAWFTNYGQWVRACAPGVDLVSTFFDNFDGAMSGTGPDDDPDHFCGWARWSGTSFAAPVVTATLARQMFEERCSAAEAVARVIDAPQLMRIPLLGTVVNVL